MNSSKLTAFLINWILLMTCCCCCCKISDADTQGCTVVAYINKYADYEREYYKINKKSGTEMIKIGSISEVIYQTIEMKGE